MMRSISTAAAAVAIAAIGTLTYLAMAGSLAPTTDQRPAEQVASNETYKLRSTQGSDTCAVTRGDQLTAGRSRLSVDPACAALLPGVEKAKYWVDKDDGSVAFTENGVDPIVTFAIADGVAYESLQPAQPVISLDAAQPTTEEGAEGAE